MLRSARNGRELGQAVAERSSATGSRLDLRTMSDDERTSAGEVDAPIVNKNKRFRKDKRACVWLLLRTSAH